MYHLLTSGGHSEDKERSDMKWLASGSKRHAVQALCFSLLGEQNVGLYVLTQVMRAMRAEVNNNKSGCVMPSVNL